MRGKGVQLVEIEVFSRLFPTELRVDAISILHVGNFKMGVNLGFPAGH